LPQISFLHIASALQRFLKCESKKRTNKEKKYRHADAVVIEMERQGET